MGLTLNVRAWAGVGDVTTRRGIGMVATLLVALAVAAAVAGVVDTVLRPDAIRVALAALTLAWMATAVGYRRAGKLELAAAAALVTIAQAGSSAWSAAGRCCVEG